MTLSEYLKAKKLTQAEFAALVGVSQSLVGHWVNDRYKPSPKSCKDIERVTNGLVARHEANPDIYDPPKTNGRA